MAGAKPKDDGEDGDDGEAVRALNLLRLDAPGATVDSLGVVCEHNKFLVRITDARPGATTVSQLLGPDIAVLSWRWDVVKTTLEEAAEVRSPKIAAFLAKACGRGFKYAWCDFCTVPQFSSDRDVPMRHVHASRVLFEMCTVFIVDLDTIVDGLRIPTLDYVSRLWTTAEMSAMLLNPHVGYGTFVELSKPNCVTVGFALQLLEFRSLGDYARLFETHKPYVGRVRENVFVSHHFTTGSLMAALAGMRDFIESAYSKVLADFLSSHGNITTYPKMMAVSSPTSLEDQEAMLRDHEERGFKSPAMDALVKAVGTQTQMPADFPLGTQHYNALLMLAYEGAVKHVFKHRKFHGRSYMEVLRSLGELPAQSTDVEGVPVRRLGFSVAGDDVVVRKMLEAKHAPTPYPLRPPHVRLVDTPAFHTLDLAYRPIPGSVPAFLRDSTFDAATCHVVSLSVIEFSAGKLQTTVSFLGETGVVELASHADGHVSVAVMLNGAKTAKSDFGDYGVEQGSEGSARLRQREYRGAGFGRIPYHCAYFPRRACADCGSAREGVRGGDGGREFESPSQHIGRHEKVRVCDGARTASRVCPRRGVCRYSAPWPCGLSAAVDGPLACQHGASVRTGRDGTDANADRQS